MFKNEGSIPRQSKRRRTYHSVNIVYYKPQEHCDEQVDCHNSVNQLDENSNIDWQNELVIRNPYSASCEKFTRVLQQFESMWHEHVGSIKAVHHRIELDKTSSWPIYSALSHAGPKAREFKKQETHRKLVVGAMGRTQTKWDSLLCLSLKMTELFTFASTTPKWMQWRSGIRTLYHRCAYVSILWATRRFFDARRQ